MSTTTAPVEAGLSEPQRIINTFVAPSKTFADVRRKPGWWAPWLLISICVILFMLVVNNKIGMGQVVQNYMRDNPKAAERMEQAPPEQRAQQERLMQASFKYFGFAAPIFILVYLLITAAVLDGTFNFGAGAEIPFKTAMAVVSYSWLPFVLHSVLAMVIIAAGGIAPDAFNLENPVATNLGFLVGEPASSPALYRIASALDVFSIWVILLMGLGFSVVSKLTRKTATLIVFAWWLVYVLGRAGMAAAFS